MESECVPWSQPKSKVGSLVIPTVEDRIVQTGVRKVIEPIFENIFAEHRYGFWPDRGPRTRRASTSFGRRSGRNEPAPNAGDRDGGKSNAERLVRILSSQRPQCVRHARPVCAVTAAYAGALAAQRTRTLRGAPIINAGPMLLRRPRADLLSLGPSARKPPFAMRPPTGKPDAGNRPVRFGGAGLIPRPYRYPPWFCLRRC